MRRSLNEVQRICQKAAEGAGAPAGLDVDAAQGAAWLLAHDLPALSDLAEDLTRFPDLAAASRFERDGFGAEDQAMDAAGKSGAVIAPMLIDLLVARAALDGVPGRLRVAGLSSPLFLLPSAVRYAAEGWGFTLQLDSGTGQSFAFHVVDGGQAEVLSSGGDDIASLFEAPPPWSLDATCARSSDQLDEQSHATLNVVLDANQLAAAAARSLAGGVSPDPESWVRLQALAAKVLVPATEQSHRMGAGALASDNE